MKKKTELQNALAAITGEEASPATEPAKRRPSISSPVPAITEPAAPAPQMGEADALEAFSAAVKNEKKSQHFSSAISPTLYQATKYVIMRTALQSGGRESINSIISRCLEEYVSQHPAEIAEFMALKH